jgi:hypothetical protein
MCSTKDNWQPHPKRDGDGFVHVGSTGFRDEPYCRAASAIFNVLLASRRRPETIEDDWTSERPYHLHGGE